MWSKRIGTILTLLAGSAFGAPGESRQEPITAIFEDGTADKASYRLDYWNEYDDAAKAYVFAGEMVVEAARTESNLYLDLSYCLGSSDDKVYEKGFWYDCFKYRGEELGSGSKKNCDAKEYISKEEDPIPRTLDDDASIEDPAFNTVAVKDPTTGFCLTEESTPSGRIRQRISFKRHFDTKDGKYSYKETDII